MNLLSIGLDYLMLKGDKVRGDVRDRQLIYAKAFKSMHSIVYSPKHLGLNQEKWADNLAIYPTNSLHKAFFILDALKIASHIIKNNSIDAITVEDPFTTGLVGVLLKKKYKIPLNVQIHSDFSNNPYWVKFRIIHRIYNLLGKFILKKADTIRVGTHIGKQALVNMGISENKISVIPVNLDVSKFKKGDGQLVRKKFLNDTHDKIVFFAGRLTREKDIPTLLKAFEVVNQSAPKTLLLIAGSGKDADKLKNIVKSSPHITNHVLFLGNVAHEEIPAYLDACDVYVVSSLYEGTCIAMAEAMSVEKPVVVTKFSGAEDLVENGKTGFKVEIQDYKTMAEKILYFLNNPEKAKEIGQNASQVIKQVFEKDQNIQKVINLWKQTASIELKA